jgi:tetratricopeptide (TPR) repeat protein
MLFMLEELTWSEPELQAFVQKALASGLGGRTRRDLLLLHLPRSVRDTFPEIENPAAQLISDLRHLGALEMESLDGPFKQWCANAADLVHWRFAEELRTIVGYPSPFPPPKPKPRPKPRKTGKLIAVAMVMALLATAAVMGKKVYDKHTNPSDDPATALIHEGRKRLAAGDAKGAFEKLAAAIRRAPKDLRLRAEAAQAAFEAGLNAQAESLFEPVVQQAQDAHLAGMALYYQARIREARGDLAGAVAAYRRSLEKRPSEDAKRRLERLTQP